MLQLNRVCPKVVGQLLAVVLQSSQARRNWDTPTQSREKSILTHPCLHGIL